MDTILSYYDPSSRPVYNASDKITVKFGYTLTQIIDMDEVNQVLTTNVWIEQEWTDERLTWDPDDYNGLQVLRMPCDKIWLPDIVLYNSADDYTIGYMQSKAMVTFNGNVFWPPPAKLRSSCKIDITYFPFDDQKCRMKFGSWTYDGYQVDVTNRSAEVDMSNYVFSGEWELLGIEIVRNEVRYACCNEPYPDVTFWVRIRRRTLYYLFNIVFPCLWLTVLSLLGFWLPPDSGEKITLGITVLLAFSVFMLLIAENMPATSEFVPLIGIYLTVTMGMTSLSIILTVFVLQLHHVGPNQKPVPKWLRTVVFGLISRIICMHSNVRSIRYEEEHRSDEMCLSTFMESSDSKNLNGAIRPGSRNNAPRDRLSERDSDYVSHARTRTRTREQVSGRVTNNFKVLISRQDNVEQFQDIVNEWRVLAQIIDRFLFWIFLVAATVSSLIILVVQPLTKPPK